MSKSTRFGEIDSVDRFLAAEKRLNGSMPEFGPSTYYKKNRAEWLAVWPVADDLGIVTGLLRVIARPGLDDRSTIVLIFASHCVSRLDFVPNTQCHVNPLWARNEGLSPTVCGPHFHSWPHNRQHVLDSGDWSLPCREELPSQVRRFSQALPWLAARVNLVLTPDQRTFDIPAVLA